MPKILSIDIETSGLSWSSDIVSIGTARTFAVPDGQGEHPAIESWSITGSDLFVQPTPIPVVVDRLGALIEEAEIVTMHNASFDLAFLLGKGLLTSNQVKGKLLDTLLTARMTGPRSSLSLASLCDEYKIGDSRWRGMKRWRANIQAVPMESVLEYNGLDALHTLSLAETLWPESTKIYGSAFTLRESDYCRIMAEIRCRGKPLDRPSVQRYTETVLRARRRMLKYILFPCRIQGPNDRTGLIKYLKRSGLDSIIPTTEKGNDSVSKDALDEIITYLKVWKSKEQLTVCLTVKKIRHMEKILSTYLHPLMEEHADVNDLVHPAYTVGGTVTYRLSSSHPNGQNMPRELSHVLWTPYISADYSQAELRLAAAYAQEPNLAQAFADGKDVHLETAALMFGKDKAKANRQTAKSTNFACVPMTTQALTPTGWKTYYELEVGDLVMGHRNENLVWTPVLEKVYYNQAPLVELSNAYFKAVTTPNHRWWGKKRRDGGLKGRYEEDSFVTTDNVNSEHTLYVSYPALTDHLLDIAPNEAAIVAYLHVEGCIKRSAYTGRTSQAKGKRVGFVGYIHQSKPNGIAEIKKVLDGIPYRTFPRKQDSLLTFSLDPNYLRDLWRRSMLDTYTLEQFVLSLDPTQRSAFFKAVWVAEGCASRNTFFTNKGTTLDALRLCAFLEGYNPTYQDNRKCIGVCLGKPYVTGQRLTLQPLDPAPVWCIRTATETWVMKQDQQISLTGNTLYGGGPTTLVTRFKYQYDDALNFLRLHRQTYPRLHKYTRKAQQVWEKRGYVTLVSGKRLWATKDDLQRSYKAFNNVIQGGVGELVKEAMMQIDAVGIPMIGQIHDSVEFPLNFGQSTVKETVDAKETVEEIMNGILPETISTRTHPPIQMKVEFEKKGTRSI